MASTRVALDGLPPWPRRLLESLATTATTAQTMLRLPAFIQHKPAVAGFALFATAASGFGQTFFIAVFGTALRAEFGLDNAA